MKDIVDKNSVIINTKTGEKLKIKFFPKEEIQAWRRSLKTPNKPTIQSN